MNIYITLDYELFMNDRTGDVEQCLITPTTELLAVLDRHNVKATFFIDAAYLYRLAQLKSQFPALCGDYVNICSQLKRIVKKDHAIGLHLHPQWFYADYDGKMWVMDFAHYKLSDMPKEDADRLYVECHHLLESITGAKVQTFRAGGYSIQGYKSFPDVMQECHITHDSSVRYRMKNISRLHYYDYTAVRDSDAYHFSADLTKEDLNGKYIEHPISTCRVFYLSYCLNRLKLKKLKHNKNWGNGGANPKKKRKLFLLNILKKTRLFVIVPATIDYQSFCFCKKMLHKYIKCQKRDFVIIGHPKNFSPTSLCALETFINETKGAHTYCTLEN